MSSKLFRKVVKCLAVDFWRFIHLLTPRVLLCIGGRLEHSTEPFGKRDPLILPGKHKFTKLIIMVEHLRLLYVGPTLVTASLGRQFEIHAPTGQFVMSCTVAPFVVM